MTMMAISLALALVFTVVWTDWCKRHLWESLGPIHHFSCDCCGHRTYSRQQEQPGSFYHFWLSSPDESQQRATRGTLDIMALQIAGPKAALSFLVFQLGSSAHCSRPLQAAVSSEDVLNQEVRIPIPLRMPRYLFIYLYGKSRFHKHERLLAIGRIQMDMSRLHGIQDVTVPFFNSDGEPSGHIRVMMKIGAVGASSFLMSDLVPYILEVESSEQGAISESSESGSSLVPALKGEKIPIVVLSAGENPYVAFPEDSPFLKSKVEKKDEPNEEQGVVTRAGIEGLRRFLYSNKGRIV